MSNTPGEWERDEQGKRFRRIGNSVEYEMEVNGVPQSVFLERNRHMKEQREKQLAEEQRKAAELYRLKRNCPLMDGLNTDCSREKCALFLDGCTLSRRSAVRDTAGLQCPLSKYRAACRTDCALYKGGCTLTGINNDKENEV